MHLCTCASMYIHKTDLASICICMRIALFSSSWWPLNWNSALKLIYKKSNFHINHASAMQSTQPSRQHTKPPPYLHTYNQLWKPGLTEFSIFLSSSSVVPVCVCVKCGKGICIQFSPHCFCAIFCRWNFCYCCCYARSIEVAYSWHTFSGVRTWRYFN